MFNYETQNDWPIVSGQMQSPIDIEHHLAQPVEDLPDFVHYQIKMIRRPDGKLSLKGDGTATLQKREARFIEGHFHHPSEHLLDGHQFDLELHLVHEFINGQKAVIALLFNVGAADATLDNILLNLPQPDKQLKLPTPIQLTDWFDAASYYHYIGSLTTPPVIEGIEWYVAATPLTIAPKQLATFKQLFPENNRQIQALNDRPILLLY
ncbi:carbonic anhydrase family protein [Lactobacillus sp. CC-MHH1034]|uniref:carbonic anhydrase family protein n=1 Tax=Agrilactobacillus fermenti TaxID=2586909 RepID=UPI001E45E126|nr:carbonic anhydrase family protein [Agrilactobacillus fermenti]MCD2255515.1 carbonic anhydrase family protein [Agrilactobacillus fermenti]